MAKYKQKARITVSPDDAPDNEIKLPELEFLESPFKGEDGLWVGTKHGILKGNRSFILEMPAEQNSGHQLIYLGSWGSDGKWIEAKPTEIYFPRPGMELWSWESYGVE